MKRLHARDEWVPSWPPFGYLYGLLSPQNRTLITTSVGFDAVVALWQFLHASDSLTEDVYDTILDVIIAKVKVKKGLFSDPAQAQDVFYEGQVRLLLAEFKVPGIAFDPRELNRPDLTFTVHFQSTEEDSTLAIECKNIRNYTEDLRDLVRTAAVAIKDAVRQHSKRKVPYSDLVVCVDLPIQMLLWRAQDRGFERFVVNLWHQLELEGFHELNETHVIFTATSQANMAAYMAADTQHRCGLTLIRPLVSGKRAVSVRATHSVLLSWLFRDQDQNPNVNNWSERAWRIDNPERLLFGH